MSVAATSSMTAEYVNPVLSATRTVFEMMLGCTPKRKGLMLKGEQTPAHDLSAVIGVTGPTSSGTIVLAFTAPTAIEALRRILGTEAAEVNREVCDAVGELTNMIAGAAKAQLAHLDLSLSIPNMVMGHDHQVVYPSNIQPICILFESDLGEFMIEVGFAMKAQ